MKKKTREIRSRDTFTGRSYRNLDRESFNTALLEKDWEAILDKPTVGEAWDFFLAEVTKEVDRLCPIKKYTVTNQKPKWISNDLLDQMRDKDYFYTKAKKTRSEDDWNIARHLRNATNRNIS